ncbi:MAG: flagellar hook capping FlgD N-terminal domain-containing protein [Brevinema sp.]
MLVSTLPTTISEQEKRVLDQNINTFNSQLKETQKIVSKNSLGEADFLTLLVTQLKTQDPTKPMDDKAFIGQMAQFTSLKQMSSVAENISKFTKEFDFTKSISLVGKDVMWADEVGNLQEGKVDSVLINSGYSYLKINDRKVALKDIVEVKESISSSTDTAVL